MKPLLSFGLSLYLYPEWENQTLYLKLLNVGWSIFHLMLSLSFSSTFSWLMTSCETASFLGKEPQVLVLAVCLTRAVTIRVSVYLA